MLFRFYLDFDGVIAHSAIECVNNAFIAWLETNHDLFNKIENNYKSSLKKLIVDFSISKRYFVIPPEHYYCLIDTIFHELRLNNKTPSDNYIQKLFEDNVSSTSLKTLEKFKFNFFRIRDKKSNSQSDTDWVKENPPTIFIEKFYMLTENYPIEIFIVSRKNYKAIEKWFLGSKLPIDEIYGNEALGRFNNNKFELIQSLQLANGNKKAFFIDDMISEFALDDWENINVITLQAGWGYNDLEDNTQEILNIIKENLNDLLN